MRKLSVCMVLTIALVPGLVAGNAEGGLTDIPSCRVPEGVTSYSDQKYMPAVLQDLVKKQMGDLVPPDSPFDETDVVYTGHNRRLIFIWTRGSRWILATEHGGFVYNDPIFAYEIAPSGKLAVLIDGRTASPDSVCAKAEELLNQPTA